jgi:hypothetical protein
MEALRAPVVQILCHEMMRMTSCRVSLTTSQSIRASERSIKWIARQIQRSLGETRQVVSWSSFRRNETIAVVQRGKDAKP